MSWLITGGAGYIGAHVVRSLQQRGESVVVYDDLTTGSADRAGSAPLVIGSVLDGALLARTIREHDVRGVVHLAAKKQVGESVERPLWYYEQNVEGLRTLLNAMVDGGVDRFVFSSSAATYGMPDVDVVTEDTAALPINPYGETKLIGEWMSRAVGTAHGMKSVAMRYFNVAGAASNDLGDPAALNLIPMVFDALEQGKRPRIFGDDYPTADGTCIRDYVHVADLADAHAEVLLRMDSLEHGVAFNVGTGTGSSVHEVMAAIGVAIGRDVDPEIVARRAGDPPRLVASVERIRDQLGWTATHDLADMVGSAWSAWRARHDGM